MPDSVRVWIDGAPVEARKGAMVAAVVAASGKAAFRRSVTGEPRGPLCGMGVCFECRLTIDGQPHARSCQLECRDGMDIRTDG